MVANASVLRALLLLATAHVLAACGANGHLPLRHNVDAAPASPADFGVCADFGCSSYLQVTLSPSDWQRVRMLFAASLSTPRGERRAVAQAVAALERMVGSRIGSQRDAPGGSILTDNGGRQMDCIDEAHNTTVYLQLFAADGLLQFHSVGEPLRRGRSVGLWPHYTATLVVADSGRRFAVDSFFHGNGVAPEIVPADLWLRGWGPGETEPAATRVASSVAETGK